MTPDRTNGSKRGANRCGSADQLRAGKRRIAASAFLVFFGVGLGFIVAETAVRLLGLGKPEFFTYSATRGWKLWAGASGWQTDEGRALVHINRWGYRGADWTRAKPAGTLRIAVLGDSFIEAPQIPEQATACGLIQQTLTRMLPSLARGRYRGLQRVEVMNFGVDGYGTAQEFFTLAGDVWQFSPDIVVLAFFPGNDVRNNSVVLEGDKCRPFFIPDGNNVVLGGPFVDFRLFHFQCFLRFESYRSQLLDMLGEAHSVLREMQRKRHRHTDLKPGIYHPVTILTNGAREPGVNDLIYRQPINQTWRDAWKVSEAEIVMTAQSVAAHHALFLLVIIGTGIQVAPNLAFQTGYLNAVGGTDLLYSNRRLTALGAQNGFAVLDLVPPMKTYAQEHHVYFHGFPNTVMGTGHWNQLGNRFAAGLIAAKLAAMMASNQNH